MISKKILIVLLLVSNILNANINVTEKDVITAIQGGVKTTKEFLKKVPTYQLYKDDKTILHYAVEFKKYDVVEYLISKDIELYRKGGLYYQTALQDAIFYQYFRIARLLINAGTPLDIQNIDGDTALHIATKNGYFDIVKLLLEKGASKNIYNNNNKTPYDLVPKFTRGDAKKIKEMLKPDKFLNIKNKKSRITTSDEIDSTQATFVLDNVYFDDQVGISVDDVTQNEIKEIIEDTNLKNSNIGIKVYTH